ncbi:MAG: GumC family protein, partial [Hyphomicrobiaceae bacterium]
MNDSMDDGATNVPVPRGSIAGTIDGNTRAVPLRPAPYSDSRPYGSGSDDGGDLRTTLLYYLRIVLKRRWLILAIAMACLGLGLTRTLMETPLYTSSVRIQIDRQAAKVVDNGAVAPADVGDAESLRTQFEILKSRSMAQRVASALKIGDDLELFKPRDFSPWTALRSLIGSSHRSDPAQASAAVREQWAVGIIAGNVTVRPVPGSRLVDIAYTDPSPARAARIANAYAEAYIDQTIDKRFQSNAYAKTFLDDQSKQLLVRLQESEQDLIKFSEDKQIIILSEKSTIAESNLAAANAALSNLSAERIRNEQIWRQVDGSKGLELPQFLSNSVIQMLRASRSALETEYQEKLETYKPSYPAMVEIDKKMKEIDRQLAVEIKTIKASLKGAYESSLEQEKDTREQIETLRTEVLALQ